MRALMKLPSFTLSLLAALTATFSAAAADTLDPEARAAIEAARKMAEKAGVKTPDLKKLMAEDADEKDEKDDADKKPKGPTTKPSPLTALPAWVTPIPGFKPAPGGTRWIEDGVEHGTISGTVAAAPRDLAEQWKNAAKEKFSSVAINDATINGALTVTVFAAYLREEQVEHKAELELKPAKGGKTSQAKISYTVAAPEKP